MSYPCRFWMDERHPCVILLSLNTVCDRGSGELVKQQTEHLASKYKREKLSGPKQRERKNLASRNSFFTEWLVFQAAPPILFKKFLATILCHDFYKDGQK